MDRNYTGGLFQVDRTIKNITKKEHVEIKPAIRVLPALLRSFKDKAQNDLFMKHYVIREGSHKIVHCYDKVFKCSLCKNLFTINSSFGKHECHSHFGYKDFSIPGTPKWSCCGKKLSEMGCMKCDHFPSSLNSSKYATSTPTLEIPLCAAIYGLITNNTTPMQNDFNKNKLFFLSRFFKDPQLVAILKADPFYMRIQLSYLDSKSFNLIKNISSGSSSNIKSLYVPIILQKKIQKGVNRGGFTHSGITKKKIYVNLPRSKIIMPLYRPN